MAQAQGKILRFAQNDTSCFSLNKVVGAIHESPAPFVGDAPLGVPKPPPKHRTERHKGHFAASGSRAKQAAATLRQQVKQSISRCYCPPPHPQKQISASGHSLRPHIVSGCILWYIEVYRRGAGRASMQYPAAAMRRTGRQGGLGYIGNLVKGKRGNFAHELFSSCEKPRCIFAPLLSVLPAAALPQRLCLPHCAMAD